MAIKNVPKKTKTGGVPKLDGFIRPGKETLYVTYGLRSMSMHCFFGLTGIAAAHTVSDVCAVMIAVGFCLWQYRQLAGMTSTQ